MESALGRRRRIGLAIAPPLVACAILLAIEVDVARSLSLTSDEPAHIGAGFSYAQHHELFFAAYRPPFAKVLVGAWLRALGLREQEQSSARVYALARAAPSWVVQPLFFYGKRLIVYDNPDFSFGGAAPGPDSITFAARIPMLVFPLLLAVTAWLWARDRFGTAGGLIALALVLTYPDALGHGALVMTDAPLAALSLLSAFAFERFALRGGAGRLVALGLALGAALATKITSLLLLAALGVVAVACLVRPSDPSPAGLLHPFGRGSPRERVTAATLAAIVAGGVALAVLWAAYLGNNPIGLYAQAFRPMDAYKMPEGLVYNCLGRYASRFWYYWPVAIGLKAPLGTIIIIILAAWAALREPAARGSFVEELALHAPAAVIFLGTAAVALPIGTRFVIAPMVFLLVSAGRLGRWAGTSRLRWAAIVALLAWNVAVVARDHPFHTSSTNPLAGDPRLVHRWLSHSNQDDGQGLKALARWQREHAAGPIVFISSFTSHDDRLLAAYGVRGTAPEGSAAMEALFYERPGVVYAVSTHLMSHAIYCEQEAIRRAGDDARRLVLGRSELPSEIVGGGILIFDSPERRAR
jgi:hypothetical protein